MKNPLGLQADESYTVTLLRCECMYICITYMPYVPEGQKNPGIWIPQNPSWRDAIFPVKFALSQNHCDMSNALHFQTSGLAK